MRYFNCLQSEEAVGGGCTRQSSRENICVFFFFFEKARFRPAQVRCPGVVGVCVVCTMCGVYMRVFFVRCMLSVAYAWCTSFSCVLVLCELVAYNVLCTNDTAVRVVSSLCGPRWCFFDRSFVLWRGYVCRTRRDGCTRIIAGFDNKVCVCVFLFHFYVFF